MLPPTYQTITLQFPTVLSLKISQPVTILVRETTGMRDCSTMMHCLESYPRQRTLCRHLHWLYSKTLAGTRLTTHSHRFPRGALVLGATLPPLPALSLGRLGLKSQPTEEDTSAPTIRKKDVQQDTLTKWVAPSTSKETLPSCQASFPSSENWM